MYKFKHDVLEIPINNDDTLVIASDNSGAIGMKALDEVKVNYQTVSYYAFRVAYMECVAAGGTPFSIILHNFNDQTVWNELIEGINFGLAEVNLNNIPITGSTETNFALNQSALGLVVLGKKKIQMEKKFNPEIAKLAVIGKPLVGQELLDDESSVAPLSLYKKLATLQGVGLIRPISSKGIKYEIERQVSHSIDSPNELDIEKSSGPSTSFLVIYDTDIHSVITDMAGKHIQLINTLTNLTK